MDAPAAAQPVSRLCPACFFCFSWKLAPDKSAALQTEQKQEGSSPQVSPKAAHSHTWMGQHQGCCHPENYGPLRPSLADSQQLSARRESHSSGPGLSCTPFLAVWCDWFSYEEDWEAPVPQPKLSLCLFLCVSIASVEALWNDMGAACGTRVLGPCCAWQQPLCWVRRCSSVTTQSWGWLRRALQALTGLQSLGAV